MLGGELTRVEVHPVVQAEGVTQLVDLVPGIDDVGGQSVPLRVFLVVLVDVDDPSPVQVVEGLLHSLNTVKPLALSLGCARVAAAAT